MRNVDYRGLKEPWPLGHKIFDNYIMTTLSVTMKDGAVFNAAKDHSGASTDYKFTTVFRTKIIQILMFIESSVTMRVQEFGSIPALTNGLQLFFKPLGGSKVYFNEEPIKSNSDIARNLFNMRLDNFGSGNNILVAKLDFSQITDNGLRCNIGDEVGIEVFDDITVTGEIVNLIFTVQGLQYTSTT